MNKTFTGRVTNLGCFSGECKSQARQDSQSPYLQTPGQGVVSVTLPVDERKEKQQQKLFLFRSEQAPVAQTEIDSNT